jgi:hypothetical protein
MDQQVQQVQQVDHFKKSVKIILEQVAKLSDQYSGI